MGRTHAVSGAAAWLAAAPALLPGLDASQTTAGMLVCAGAALLPDLDHPSATLSRSVPVAGAVAAGALGALSGGHRHGLHSVLAVAGCWLLVGLLCLATFELPGEVFAIPAGAAVLLTCMFALAARALGLTRGWVGAWLLGAGLAVAASWHVPGMLSWLPVCVALGYAAHLAGDILTVGGVPLLWPLMVRLPAPLDGSPVAPSRGFFALPLLGRTGSLRESLLGFALAGFAVVVLGLQWLPDVVQLLPAVAAG